ncbi:MAG: trimeric autotransporter adhesin, partial [Micromonosporaceae bacterium]|nr:trimeric autotransporter adhesin [Micromonosporaceae bacterium]
AGVTQVGIDAIGAAGTTGESTTYNDAPHGEVIPGGSGGLGSEVQTTVSVTAGQTLYIGVDSSSMPGATGGLVGALPAEPGVSGAGGAGGNASYVSASDPQASAPCNPAGSNLLVVAAGGGGGGGASTYFGHSGGNGGTEAGSAAGAGGSNGTHDGGPGGTAGAAGGTGGSGGHGSEYAGAPVFVNECLPGEDGGVGTPNRGGDGGSAAQDPTAGSNCQGYSVANGGGFTNGGGGGGGGGFYGGGGGGGADDADTGGAGGGGGAGSSYMAGQAATPTATTADPTVSITPVMTLPQFTSGPTSGTCTAEVYCSFSFATSGFPTPSMNYTSNDLNLTGGDLTFKDYGNGTATITGIPSPDEVGVHTIVVVAQNTTSSTSAPVTRTFTLTIGYGPLSSLTMSPTVAQAGSLIANYGQTQFSVRGVFASGYQADLSNASTWTSSNTTVATVSSSGVVAAHAAGPFTLTAAYAGRSAAETLMVSNGDATQILVTPANSSTGPNPSVDLGSTLQFKATAVYVNGSSADVTNQVTWSSIGTIKAPITAGGLATATGSHDGDQDQFGATFTNADGLVSSATAFLTVTLTKPTSITVSPNTVGPLAAGATQQFTATGTFPGGLTADVTSDVTWQSSDTRIAPFSIGTPGLLQSSLTAGGGSITVTAYAGATATPTAPNGSVSATATVTFAAGRPTGISVGDSTRSIGLGATQQLVVTATYSDGSTATINSGLTWQTSAPGTVTVSSTGLITGVGTTANAASNVGVSYVSPTGTLSANTIVSLSLDSPTSIAISPLNPTVPRGSSLSFTATGTYPGGATADLTRTVLWTSSNTLVGAFSANLLTTSNQAGGQTTSVEAIAPNNVSSPATTVTVAVGDPTSVAVTVPNTSALILGHTEQATATANYVNGTSTDVSANVVWASADPSVVSVSATGVVTAVSKVEGASTYVTATLTTGTGAKITTGSPSISTSLRYPTSITVTPDSATVVAGATLAYTATGNYPGGVTVDITHSVQWTTVTGIPDSRTGMNNNVLVASSAGPTGAPVSVAATWGAVGGATSVTIGPAVSVSGPTSTTATAGVPFTSPTLTATGGSGTYTWSYSGALGGLSLSSTTGSSVTISGTPSQADANGNGTITVTDTTYPTDSIVRIFNINVGYQAQQITFAPPATAAIGQTETLSATGGGSGNLVTFSPDPASTNGTCFVSGTTVNFYTAGTCVIDADQNGTNTVYSRAPEVQASIQVGTPQVLGFTTTAPSSVPAGSSSYAVAAHDVGAATTNPITLSIDPATTNHACSLSGVTVGSTSTTGAVGFDHAGVCIVDADQSSSPDYLTASRIQQTITVGSAAQTLAFSSSAPTSARVGDADYTPTITGGGSTQPVVLTVDATTTNSACAVSGTAVQIRHLGTCVLDADQAGDADHAAAAQVQQTFSIAPASQVISFASAPPATNP